MTVNAEAMAGMVIFKTGTLDDEDAVESSKPSREIYNKNRPSWCEGFSCAEQKEVV